MNPVAITLAQSAEWRSWPNANLKVQHATNVGFDNSLTRLSRNGVDEKKFSRAIAE